MLLNVTESHTFSNISHTKESIINAILPKGWLGSMSRHGGLPKAGLATIQNPTKWLGSQSRHGGPPLADLATRHFSFFSPNKPLRLLASSQKGVNASHSSKNGISRQGEACKFTQIYA
jgi:hypothetical protein